MDYAGYGGASAIGDVGHGAGYGSCHGYAAEEIFHSPRSDTSVLVVTFLLTVIFDLTCATTL